jgi:hypothetical protein
VHGEINGSLRGSARRHGEVVASDRGFQAINPALRFQGVQGPREVSLELRGPRPSA